jgi:hypothetical protein
MLVNFGDNRNGNGTEEPKEQEGSFAPLETKPVVEEEPVKKSQSLSLLLRLKKKLLQVKTKKYPLPK